jgi:hypothetical protein
MVVGALPPPIACAVVYITSIVLRLKGSTISGIVRCVNLI